MKSDALDEPLAGHVVGGSSRTTDSTTIDSSDYDDDILLRLLLLPAGQLVERSRGRRGVPYIPARGTPSSCPWRCTVCAAATSHVVGQVHGRSEITASCGTQTQLKTSCTAPSDGGVRSLLTCLHPVDGGWGLSSDPQSPSLAAHWIFGSTRGSYQMCGLGAYCHIHWSCWGTGLTTRLHGQGREEGSIMPSQ